MEHQPDIENPMSESEALTYWMNKANKYGEILDEILSLCVYNESSPELVGKVEKLAAYAFPKSTTKELPKAMNDAVSAIYNAMQEVEKMPADIRLTKAITFLSNAKGCVSDFIDGVEREQTEDADMEEYRGDLQDQIKEHIKTYTHFDWNEAMSENEMECLVDLMLTFRYKP